jgi:hypothetical protein
MRAIVVSLLVFAAGCDRRETICSAPRECIDTYGDLGLCLEMRCAFRDGQCASGYRFDDSAGDLANMCVSASDLPRDAGTSDALVPDGG